MKSIIRIIAGLSLVIMVVATAILVAKFAFGYDVFEQLANQKKSANASSTLVFLSQPELRNSFSFGLGENKYKIETVTSCNTVFIAIVNQPSDSVIACNKKASLDSLIVAWMLNNSNDLVTYALIFNRELLEKKIGNDNASEIISHFSKMGIKQQNQLSKLTAEANFFIMENFHEQLANPITISTEVKIKKL